MFGDSFCKAGGKQSWASIAELSIPMFGDSFCKKEGVEFVFESLPVFQSPCLGTLFASNLGSLGADTVACTFNPHVWGLFLQAH